MQQMHRPSITRYMAFVIIWVSHTIATEHSLHFINIGILDAGSTAGGHYVAVCKHPVTRKWHEFNDNM